MTDRTLVDIVENFRLHGPETAYVHRHGYRIVRWSYGRLAECVRRMSAELWQRGIRHGDRVLFWGDDSPEWVVSFFGCVCRGAVVVPLDRTSSREFVRRVAEHTGARLCLCSAVQQPTAPSPATMLFDTVAELPGPNPDIPIVSPESKPGDPVEIVFTSGTTADPKGVVLTHENILANIRPLEREIARYRRYERLVHPLRFLNLVPLSHVFGQLLGVFIPQLLGATVVFPASLAPSDIIRTAREERVSVLVAVPRILDSLRNRIEDELATDGLSGDLKRSLSGISYGAGGVSEDPPALRFQVRL